MFYSVIEPLPRWGIRWPLSRSRNPRPSRAGKVKSDPKSVG